MIQAKHINGFAIRLQKSRIHLTIWAKRLIQFRIHLTIWGNVYWLSMVFLSVYRNLWVLSIMPKILDISVGIQMERFVSVSSDQNIRDHLWRWSFIPTESYRSIFQVSCSQYCSSVTCSTHHG